eukprot:4207396-Amphidinium_carterae.1
MLQCHSSSTDSAHLTGTWSQTFVEQPSHGVAAMATAAVLSFSNLRHLAQSCGSLDAQSPKKSELALGGTKVVPPPPGLEGYAGESRSPQGMSILNIVPFPPETSKMHILRREV